MPRSLLSRFGKRQPRALVLGLRRIIKDPQATVAERLRACELLAIIEGFTERPSRTRGCTPISANKAQNSPHPISTNPANAIRMRQLLELSRTTAQRETGRGVAGRVPQLSHASTEFLTH